MRVKPKTLQLPIADALVRAAKREFVVRPALFAHVLGFRVAICARSGWSRGDSVSPSLWLYGYGDIVLNLRPLALHTSALVNFAHAAPKAVPSYLC